MSDIETFCSGFHKLCIIKIKADESVIETGEALQNLLNKVKIISIMCFD